MAWRWIAYLILACLTACASAPQGTAGDSTDGNGVAPPSAAELRLAHIDGARQMALRIGDEYVHHSWTGGPDNAFHGVDALRNQIDTPDELNMPQHGWSMTGAENVGVPYKWGGFSSLIQFDQGIADGKLAGHIPTSGKSAATMKAVGVDCSGLVSRCWQLRGKKSTRSLPKVCIPLSSYDELQPGDALNVADRHVMLFVEFENADKSRLKVVEATASQGKVHYSSYPRDVLIKNGYQPLRYRGFLP
jgi:cell wall-associated NlpC family hydrolase